MPEWLEKPEKKRSMRLRPCTPADPDAAGARTRCSTAGIAPADPAMASRRAQSAKPPRRNFDRLLCGPPARIPPPCRAACIPCASPVRSSVHPHSRSRLFNSLEQNHVIEYPQARHGVGWSKMNCRIPVSPQPSSSYYFTACRCLWQAGWCQTGIFNRKIHLRSEEQHRAQTQ